MKTEKENGSESKKNLIEKSTIFEISDRTNVFYFVKMKYFILYASMVFFLTMCKNRTDDPPKPSADPTDIRANFIGEYKVISENPNYYFTINMVDSINQQWFDIHNICNSFDMVFTAKQDYQPKNYIAFPSYFPIRDKFFNRWDFGVYANDTIRNVNLIVNDTFRLYYRLQNMPWHAEDDTTYMNKMFLMVAVRNK